MKPKSKKPASTGYIKSNDKMVYKEEVYEEYRKNKNKKVFERVIEEMMLADHYDESFKPVIEEIRGIVKQHISNKKKRFAILSVLDKNIKLLVKLKAFTDTDITKMEHIEDVCRKLRDYVKIAPVDRDKFGEVMTPLELIKEMLKTLPNKVWSNPNLKWLDPANGTGPFLAMVVYRLMKGLKECIPDEVDRYRHIMNNMIYSVELQPKNMFLYMMMMNPYDDDYINMNIYTGSFLDKGFDNHTKEVWNIEKFDIILGNSPYNDGSNNTGNTLWDKFVLKSFSFLNENGYLNMVHPNGWRNIEGKFAPVKKLLLSKDILYLNLNSFEDGMRVFNAGTTFDYYCIRNSSTSVNTKLIDIDNKEYNLDLKKVNFIPNCNIDWIYSLISDDKENNVNVIVSYDYEARKEWMNDKEEDDYIYPCVYSIKQGGVLTFKWSKINTKGHFGIPKIICGNGANPTFTEDYEGRYGMTQWAYGIVDDDLDNLKQIYKVLSSDKIKEITRATKFVSTNGNPVIYPKILSLFRKDFWKDFINN